MGRYSKIAINKIPKGPRYYVNIKYPKIPLDNTDLYVITTRGDRFDTLANQFYGDESLWWVISSANQTLPQNSLFIPQGTQIRIPRNYDLIVRKFNSQIF
jgi:phage tail protein X